MALWQIIKPGKGMQAQWDDGLRAKPGEPDFSADKIKAYAGEKNFNYIGTPNWEPPAEETGLAVEPERP